jgi:alpha-beta hydrolase superfamily lysophospholipase
LTHSSTKTKSYNGGKELIVREIDGFFNEMDKIVDNSALPKFLFGHSMGGLMCLHYAVSKNEEFPFRGAIASGMILF